MNGWSTEISKGVLHKYMGILVWFSPVENPLFGGSLGACSSKNFFSDKVKLSAWIMDRNVKVLFVIYSFFLLFYKLLMVVDMMVGNGDGGYDWYLETSAFHFWINQKKCWFSYKWEKILPKAKGAVLTNSELW